MKYLIYNGIPATDLRDVSWQKSHRSNSQGNCVELAQLPDGSVAVRNSRHPAGPALLYTKDEMQALIMGVKAGDFDSLIA